MPTIYHYTEPHVVDQSRYDILISRKGWYATPTLPTSDGTQQGMSGGTVYGDVLVGTATKKQDIRVMSNALGGYDVAGTSHVGEYDSTGRIVLTSYQNGSGTSQGGSEGTLASEVLRFRVARRRAKAAEAWQVPVAGYDANEDAILTNGWRTVAFVHAHYDSNTLGDYHSHWQVETPTSTGQITNRFSVSFGDTTTGAIGVDIASVEVVSSNFFFKGATSGANYIKMWNDGAQLEIQSASNKATAVFRNSIASATNTQPILQLTGTDSGNRLIGGNIPADTNNRFSVEVSGRIEWGSGAAARDVNLFRSSADVLRTDDSLSVGTNLRVNTTSTASGVGIFAMANATTLPTGTPAGGGVLYVEAGALKYKGSSGTITVLGNA